MLVVSTINDLTEATKRTPMPVVWGYVRVSTQKQEDEGLSLDAQREGIAAYCKANDLAEPVIVQEVASAGKPLLAVRLPGTDVSVEPTACPRPLFAQLVSHLLRAGKTSHKPTLVVWKMDRMSRVASESEMFHDLFLRSGVTLRSTQSGESGTSDDPGAQFTRQVLAAAAQYERQLTMLRSQAGVRQKAHKGGWLGGNVPCGYRAHDGDLVVDEATAAIVRRVFHMRDELMMSYGAIVEHFSDRGDRSWSRMRVSRILNNRDLYNGFYTDPHTETRHPRPDLRILPEKQP